MKTIRQIKKQGLPLHVFPDEVRKFIKDFALGSGSQESFVAAGVLACSSGMCSKHLIKVKGSYTERANLFIAVVGVPGVNKSSPIKVALGPMMQVEAKNNKAYKAKQREWENSLKAKLTAQERQSIMSARPQRMPSKVITDGSIEAMFMHLETMGDTGETPHCVYVKDELKGFFGGMDKYKSKGGDEYETWLSLFSGADLVKTLVSKTLFVSGARATVIGGIQPEVYNECMGDKGDGMIDRFMIAIHEDGPEVTDIFSQCSAGTITAYNHFMLNMEEMDALEYDLWSGPEVEEVLAEVQSFHAWCALVGETHETGAFKKWEQCFYRIIIIMSAMWCRESVTLDSVRKARDLMEFFVSGWLTAKIMAETTSEEKLRSRVHKSLERHGASSLRDIQRRTKVGKMDDMKKLISEMVEDGEVIQMNDSSQLIRKALFKLSEV